MHKKKIGVIGLKGLPGYGGAATVGENLILQLKDEFDFTVYAVESHVKDPNYNLIKQIVFKAFPIKKLNIITYYLKSTFHALFFKKYDLIHLHHIDAAFIMFFLRLRYKVISTNHGMPYLHGKWPKYLLPYFRINEKIHIWLSSKVIVVSKDLYRHFKKSNFKQKVNYIPNGTNSELSIHVPRKKFNLVFVAGRIIHIKGLHILLNALNKSNLSLKLLVIGDLYHEENYKSETLDPLMSSLDITFKDVIYKKEQLFKEILSADFFIFPSLIEAMSTMLLEVASIGVPIICSDIIQNRDIFSDKEVLFFKSNDSDDLKKNIDFALNNSDIMIEKANNAKEKVSSEFSWDTIGLLYNKVYRNIIK